jgi:hypothetical protein
MLKHLLLTTSVAATTLLVSAGQVLAGAFFIDTFNQTPAGPSPDSGALFPSRPNQDIFLGGVVPGTPSTLPPTGPDPYLRTGINNDLTIGGTRLLDHELLANPGNPNRASRARILSNGVLSVGNITTNIDSRTTVRYDANDPLMGLAKTGQNKFLDRLERTADTGAFQLNFSNVGPNPTFSVDATIRVVTGTTGMMEMAQVTATGLKAGPTAPTLFNFSDFLAMNSMLDFNDVKYIELVLDGPPGFTFELDSFRVFEIPEPSAILGSFLALGLGLGLNKQRQEDK